MQERGLVGVVIVGLGGVAVSDEGETGECRFGANEDFHFVSI